MTDSPYYHAGKLARAENRDRSCPDGRMSPSTRTQWYQGWDDEDRFRAPALSVDQRAKLIAGWDKVKEAL